MYHHEVSCSERDDTAPEHTHDPFIRLEAIIRRDAYLLKQLTSGMSPLSIERISRIDPGAADRAEAVAQSDISWPDVHSAALTPDYAATFAPLVDEDADLAFVVPILKAESEEYFAEAEGNLNQEAACDNQAWAKGYNNFPTILKAVQLSASPEVARDRMQAGDLLGLTYGTKPYLERAHAVAPDFMDALQQSVAALGGMEAWRSAMLAGYLELDESTLNTQLLVASRTAFVLLARLMRRDDLRTQKRLLGFPNPDAPLIENPANELAT